MQSAPFKKHVSFVYSLHCLFLPVDFDTGDDRCLWGRGGGGGGGGGDAAKKTVFDCR